MGNGLDAFCGHVASYQPICIRPYVYMAMGIDLSIQWRGQHSLPSRIYPESPAVGLYDIYCLLSSISRNISANEAPQLSCM